MLPDGFQPIEIQHKEIFESFFLKDPPETSELTLFESVGGFPEVPIAEDLYLVRRLSKIGRIPIAPVYAVTSSRRWQKLGLLRTTLIHQIILVGIDLGVVPHMLASLYPVLRRQ